MSKMHSIETTQIDLRFEGLRLKDPHQEEKLLCSIVEEGVRESLRCVVKDAGEKVILLDGFKRYRCARKTGIAIMPVISLGTEETQGIVALIRSSSASRLHALEEASQVNELRNQYGMGLEAIAGCIGRSPAWVRVRLGMFEEMSEGTRQEIFSGRFPIRSYLYTLRPRTRVRMVKTPEVDQFVKATSGKGLSTRNLDLLAEAYFKGPKLLKEQIEQGNLDWTLRHLGDEQVSKNEPTDMSQRERIVLSNLERAQKYIGRVTYELNDGRLRQPRFLTCGRALAKRMLDEVPLFIQTLKAFYDSSGHTESDPNTS